MLHAISGGVGFVFIHALAYSHALALVINLKTQMRARHYLKDVYDPVPLCQPYPGDGHLTIQESSTSTTAAQKLAEANILILI